MKIRHHRNEKELELKSIPQLSLGLLLGKPQSAIGQFFFLTSVSPRSFCEKSLTFLLFSKLANGV